MKSLDVKYSGRPECSWEQGRQSLQHYQGQKEALEFKGADPRILSDFLLAGVCSPPALCCCCRRPVPLGVELTQLYPADLPWSLSLDSHGVRSLSTDTLHNATNVVLKSLLL